MGRRATLMGGVFSPSWCQRGEGCAPKEKKFMHQLLKVLLGHSMGWSRTMKSQQAWQSLSFSIIKGVAIQLSAVDMVEEGPWTPVNVASIHQHYTFHIRANLAILGQSEGLEAPMQQT